MTIETLSSFDDDDDDGAEGPRGRRRRWLAPALGAAVVVGLAVAGLVVQRHQADERRAVRLAALDDGRVLPTLTGGGTRPGVVELDVAILNAGTHAVVLGPASITAPGVTVQSSSLSGHSVPPGASLTDELHLNVSCPAAADARSGGQVLIVFTTAAHRRHVTKLTLEPDPHRPNSAAMSIIRSQCGALEAAEATTLDVLEIVPHRHDIYISAELTNVGRSRLTVRAIDLGDDRLRLAATPRLPLSVQPRGSVRIQLRVTVAHCGPEVDHRGTTFTVISANEYGEEPGNQSQDELDRAFRKLVSVRCPQG